MRLFSEYISEERQKYIFGGTDNRGVKNYTCTPANRKELIQILVARDFNGDMNDIDVSEVTNMQSLCSCCWQCNFDISKWDVSNVTDMSWMFNKCYVFNCDLSQWDVSNVTDMSFMFNEANNFNSDIGNWDVSKVRYMKFMFSHAWCFDQDLNKWDVNATVSPNGTNCEGMFRDAKKMRKHLPRWYSKFTWE